MRWKETGALQSGLLRRIYEEVATLNGQPAVCMFFDMEKFYYSVSACLKSSIRHWSGVFPRQLLYMAMQAYRSERFHRAGEMVGQSYTALQRHPGWLPPGKQICESGFSTTSWNA